MIRLFILVSMFLLFLVGCGQQAPQDSQQERVTTNSNELTLALGSEPDEGFDPTTGWGRYGSPLFQSTLFTYDQELKVVNDLATEYEVSDDGLVWTVTLRDDVTFSDGEPLTSADVKYTFETAAASGSVVDLQIIEKVEATAEHMVTFTLKEPHSTFIHALVATGIVPKHAHNDNYASQPMGSGPYQFAQWDKGQQLIVTANPLYYGKKPSIEKVTILFLNEDAAFAAAQAGTVDVAAIPVMFGKQGAPGMRLEILQSVDNRGIVFPIMNSGEQSAQGLPIGNDVTADPAIRQAINIAIDREALVEGVLEGFGTPAYTPVDGLPWWNPETVIEDGDLERAKQLLEEAGWRDEDGDGIREKGARRAEFTLVYPSSDVTRQSLAIATADMLKPLGIKITVDGKGWEEIGKLKHEHAILMGWGSHDPSEMYNLYHSKYAGIESFNPGFYKNEKVDHYLDQALTATDQATANEFWKKAQWDGSNGFSAKGDAAWAWLVNLDHLYLVNEKLDIGQHKIQPHGHGWPITDHLTEWKWNE
ncbi:nickel ABC transporter substrate-binding protein [Ammoniphilus oxalaticus]|uniref:Nickel ABC transporter substrate-binding protein n=1 Tax=Ammoniphilus oxalaticus TaxID=66863 RepID=A0A419SHG1_9BACL|nr:ABC transporter substrate-binding protein [Ammoniphilus oxalaticus]RKD23230.1 nickel ABC transporter substrate-binding protein [Ammoniphilus oxalaticus]